MKSQERRWWTRQELLATLNLYCRTPFGKLHKSNPSIIALASVMGRSPSALAMKLVNFASLDPYHKARDIKGLGNVSNADRAIWDEFYSDRENLVIASQDAITSFAHQQNQLYKTIRISKIRNKPTETTRETKVRLAQSFFRDIVLASYNNQCAVCKLNLSMLLIASHIIPWAQDQSRRVDPTNGLALCTLHDRAFDRGLITLSKTLQVIVSKKAKKSSDSPLQKVALSDIDGLTIDSPGHFEPDEKAVKYHRENIFVH